MLGVCMPSAAPPQPGLLEVTSSQRRKDVQTRTHAKRVLEETGVHTPHPPPHHVSHSQVCSGAGSPPGPSSPLLPLLPLFPVSFSMLLPLGPLLGPQCCVLLLQDFRAPSPLSTHAICLELCSSSLVGHSCGHAQLPPQDFQQEGHAGSIRSGPQLLGLTSPFLSTLPPHASHV